MIIAFSAFRGYVGVRLSGEVLEIQWYYYGENCYYVFVHTPSYYLIHRVEVFHLYSPTI